MYTRYKNYLCPHIFNFDYFSLLQFKKELESLKKYNLEAQESIFPLKHQSVKVPRNTVTIFFLR